MPLRRALAAVLLGVMATALPPPADASRTIFESGFDEAPEGPYSRAEAARFLTQATFGPTLASIEALYRQGYNAWFSEQFAAPPSLQLPFLDQLLLAGQEQVWQDKRQEIWWRNVLTGPDQLRQRMAFALSQILVVSDQNGALEGNPTTLAHYYDQLVQHAFGNYRTLLEVVTLHPAMGHYLSMFKNRKPDPAQNIRPDENFAREIMQLFSVGLWWLHPDGTLVDGNPAQPGVQPIPTYGQETIRGFAHVFTGWNYSTCEPPVAPEGAPQFNWWSWTWCPAGPQGQDWRLQPGWRTPMKPWGEGTPFGDIYHAVAGSKQLLNYPGVTLPGGVLGPGGTARGNLGIALDNVFHHPNVGPFIARRLIQRFTTSNPSPAYVGRVAAVFANDGQGVRGNLKAVVRAILMDPEARRPELAPSHFGKLREPLLRMTQMFRALDARSRDGRIREGWPEYHGAQAVLRSPTVFNFFLPDYALPGEIAQSGLVAPEFQIATDPYIIRMHNFTWGRISWAWWGNPGLGSWDPLQVDLNREMAIAHDPERLLERLSLLFMSRRMPPAMFDLLLVHLRDMTVQNQGGEENWRRRRVQDALWLILSSPQYLVEK
ncbi:MAG: hypothetical protein KatS3mg125_1733 [Lysobacterales bacterium]|jgi:uncharacterized protein (DUF1800 family)|nr:MAG: hypothetical protein KatS3mg125_1733 [Xanthomonadales bacterium]